MSAFSASRKKWRREKPASLRRARPGPLASRDVSRAHEKDSLLHVQLGQRDRPRPALRRERAHKTPGLYRCCAEEYGLGGAGSAGCFHGHRSLEVLLAVPTGGPSMRRIQLQSLLVSVVALLGVGGAG